MKPEDISNAINSIDDEIINSANEIRKPKKHKTPWVKYIAAAAVIAIVAFGGIRFFAANPNQSPEVPPSDGGNIQSGEAEPSVTVPELPKLVYEASQSFAMGFEGYLAYEIDELANGNPWNESMSFETLPVYKNTAFHETGLPNGGLTKDEMLSIINEITGGDHGLPEYSYVGDFSKGSGVPDEQIYSIEAVYGNTLIEIDPFGNITSRYDYGENKGASLPEDYEFTHCNSSAESAFAAIEYIYGIYSNLIGIEDPTFVYSKDYTYNGEINASYSIYDFSGDELNDILNFSFNRVQLAPNDNGELMLIRIYDGLAAAEKIGDYPIITPEKAKEKLIEGGCITSVPYEVPGEKYIAKVELIYRSGNSENIFMPYYRFLVEVPELEAENGLKTFGAYYIPAVKSEYLEGWPIWNGSFN